MFTGTAPERAEYQTRLMTDECLRSSERSSRSALVEAVVWALIVVLLGISCVAFLMLWNRVSAA